MIDMTLARCGIGRSFRFPCLVFFTLFSVLSAFSNTWDTEGAARDFQQAQRQKAIIAQSAQPALRQYLQCAKTYRNVYLKDPHYARAGDAIYEEGLIYHEMGDKFAAPEFYKTAVKRFSFLISDYGANQNCPDALLRTGNIYSNNLNDEDAAQEAFQRLRTRYRNSSAFSQLKQTNLVPKPAQQPPAADAIPAAVGNRTAAARMVQNIRYWSTNDYTRVLIDTSSDVRYQKALLSNPQRIYFDIFNAKLSGDLRNRTFAVEDDLLRQVRMWQNSPDIVRVVLDLSGKGDHSVFELHDPFRIVIDLHRQGEATTGPRHSSLESNPRPDENAPMPASRPLTGEIRAAKKAPQPSARADVEKTPPSTQTAELGTKRPASISAAVEPSQPRSAKPVPAPDAAGAGIPSSVETPIAKAAEAQAKPAGKQDAPSVQDRAPVTQPPPLAVAEIEPPPPKLAKPDPAPASATKTAKIENKTADTGKKLPPAVTPNTRAVPKAAARTSNGDRTLTRMLGLKIGRVVIDPGHGGHDLGCVGPGGLLEKDLVLSLALELRKLLEEELGAEVFLTRTNDTFISLEERTAIANRHRADLFISIHANSSRSRSASGVETYYLDFARTDAEREVAARENATTLSNVRDLEDLIKKIAQADKSMESRELASIVQKRLYAGVRKIFSSAKNRGVRRAPFVVLIGANMPSVLTEVAFISNPKDERLLRKGANQQRMAKALYSGIEDYIKTLGMDVVQNRPGPNK